MIERTERRTRREMAREAVVEEFVRHLLRDGYAFDPGFKELWTRREVLDFVDSFAAQVERRL